MKPVALRLPKGNLKNAEAKLINNLSIKQNYHDSKNLNLFERERKSLEKIRNEYSKYLVALQANSQELMALLNRSGYQTKSNLIQAWDRKDNSSILLRFSRHDENDIKPDHGHERINPVTRDPYFLHPDGDNNIDGAYASGGGVPNSGGEIILARTLLTFQECVERENWVVAGEPSYKGENLNFDYTAMKASAYKFINRIISHEMTHVGADVNRLTKSVIGRGGSRPAWITIDGTFNLFNIPFILYHRGDVYEAEAYNKIVSYKDAEYGFAVNVYFRTLGRMDCSVAKNKIWPIKDSDAATKKAIWDYIRANEKTLRSFKPYNRQFPGGWNIPFYNLDH